MEELIKRDKKESTQFVEQSEMCPKQKRKM